MRTKTIFTNIYNETNLYMTVNNERSMHTVW